MSFRNTIRLFSYAVCIVAVLAAYAIIGNNQSTAYKTKLEAVYQQSLMELSECLDSIETNLTKSGYAATPTMMATLSEDLYSECSLAKNELSHLPIEQMNLSGTYKFLSQAADYSQYLSEKTRTGTEISNEEYENMQKLLEYAKSYSKSVKEMVTRCTNGGDITGNEVKSKNSNANVASLSLDFTQAEEAFADYPTLIYDGPFADAVLNREPAVTKDAPAKTRDECLKTAAKALYVNTDKLTYSGDSNGAIPCYNYTMDGYTVAVSKGGGYVAYILGSGKVNSQSITQENAVNVAKAYLKKLGYQDMVQTYYAVENNVCVINFAYAKNNVIYYSDLIKVGVSLADGKIYSLEADGFLTNHRERNDFSMKIAEKDLQKKISSHVEIISSRHCVIPKKNGKEAPCVEYHCRNKATGDEVLIYMNTNTGEEENILMLLYSDNGTLTK
ncbi:MAG: germination protein YpeB [Eubacterium sp.]|nr:germination protein YpeB [Eubacterium sp.]